MMLTWKSLAIVCMVVGSLSFAGRVGAQSPKASEKTAAPSEMSNPTRDMNDYTCKDLMRTSGEDRIIGLALLHGYFLGKRGTTTFQPEAMRKATDQFVEYCLDHPTTKVLEAMSQFVK
jgi:hypothetical protein